MGLALVGRGGWSSGPSPQPTVLPAGVQVGDLVVYVGHQSGSAVNSLTLPGGWNSALPFSQGTGAWLVGWRIVAVGEAATMPAPTVGGNTAGGWCYGQIIGWRGVNASSPLLAAQAQDGNLLSPTYTATGEVGELDVWEAGLYAGGSLAFGTLPAGLTDLGSGSTGSSIVDLVTAGYLVQTGGTVGGRTLTSAPTTPDHPTALLVVVNGNSAPYAPTLLSPTGNQAFDRAQPQTFRVQPNDPNPGDSTSALGLRYRITGTSTWTTVTQAGPQNTRTFPGGTFAAGAYEWQAQTTDSGGLTSPWSGSEFFTAADTPNAPVITAPTGGATITAPTGATVGWSASQQEAYQVRVVADLAGSPDPSTVYSDTGTVVSTDRSVPVARPVNGRTEQTQVRVRYLGLWSPWASVRNLVAYTEPARPNVSLTVDGPRGFLLVTIAHPTPSSGQPAVLWTDLWRRKTGTTSALRVASGLPAGVWTDRKVAHRQDYEYQAQAWGANGASSLSGWTGTATDNTTTSGAGAYGAGAYGEGAYGE